MKRTKRVGKCALGFAVVAALLLKTGCGGNDFLGLEDYQRDLLIGGLAAALLAQQAVAPAGDDIAPSPIDGRDGEDGQSCWDLNGNGVADTAEDINGDGNFDALDCQGTDGADGSPGTPGQDGTAGLSCWDLNGNGQGDAAEDINGDGNFDALDCQGADGSSGSAGPAGPAGPSGAPGADGPEYFDTFVDDFFTADDAPRGHLPVVLVSIEEPVLGIRDRDNGFTDAVAFRVAIPNAYEPGNDVTMRLFFYRTGYFFEDCFIFTVDALRLRGGSDIAPYGETRWIRPHSVEIVEGNNNSQPGVFLVIDLPVNTAAGLGYPNDLETADFLALELATYQPDGYVYHLLGAEFFESAAGSATLGGAVVFDSEADVTCEYPDCNSNRVDDAIDIAEGTSEDCNENEIPDECDIGDGTSEDCNENDVPDECDLCSPQTGLFSAQARIGLTANGDPPIRVLWWDSTPEYGIQALDAYREEMSDYLTNFNGGGVFASTYVSSEVPGTFATHMDGNFYDVIVFDATSSGAKFNAADLDAVVVHYSDHSNVLLDGILYIRSIDYGVTTDFPGVNESTGKFTVNEVFQLANRGGGIMIGTDHNCCQTDANQVLGAIIPGAVFTGLTTPSLDGSFNGDDLLNAIAVASPFDIFEHWAEVPSQAIAPTGPFTDIFGNAITLFSQVDVADFVGGPKYPYISTSWEPGGVGPEFDCNENGILDSEDIVSGYSQDANQNGIPDECEELDCSLDCNENGIPDECELGDNDCNENGIPDDCELDGNDCNENGVPDECDLGAGDCNENRIPDECEPDCNENGVPDDCDILHQTSLDCQPNGIPDECDIADGTSEDCQPDGIPDECGGGCEICVCHDDVGADCHAFVGPIHGPDGMAAFDEWIATYGGTLIDFESLATGTNLRDQLVAEHGVHFASISGTGPGMVGGPYHVEVSGQHPNTAYGNTIVGSPCDPGCVDDGRVIYEATFDEPKRWVGIERLWLTENTITEFYSGEVLIHRYEDMPCYTSWAPYFFGYVVPSENTQDWITRIVMSGKPDDYRQVGYSDNLRFGTAMLDEQPEDGAFVCYEKPQVDDNCEFICLEPDTGQTAGGSEPSCRVICDPPSDLFYPIGETVVTCTAEMRVGEDPWVQVDECSFTVNVTCAD